MFNHINHGNTPGNISRKGMEKARSLIADLNQSEQFPVRRLHPLSGKTKEKFQLLEGLMKKMGRYKQVNEKADQIRKLQGDFKELLAKKSGYMRKMPMKPYTIPRAGSGTARSSTPKPTGSNAPEGSSISTSSTSSAPSITPRRAATTAITHDSKPAYIPVSSITPRKADTTAITHDSELAHVTVSFALLSNLVELRKELKKELNNTPKPKGEDRDQIKNEINKLDKEISDLKKKLPKNFRGASFSHYLNLV
ncbi:hypothetical protein MCT03_09550 [Vibrio aestuarianus]|uniref:hypothetical protein n=1 Tax=Vibrio aestuarianus TaxID=28171 RepID=UPI00237CEDC1|nr:hypothetical protein [Vibrio aestuarianus]MDE1224522.1 hypothetical protein [Vibrio aestuarianus]MDE1338895.1 hypothetical protein [Vibrio aestuarianus]